MNDILKKILEEIDYHAIKFESFGMCNEYVSVGWIKEIIRSHMDKAESNGWIPVSERLPEVPEGTEDDDCPEFNVMIKGAKKATTLKYATDGTWFDDWGEVYKVVAWKPLPEPYKGE
mgnify:CR=1 FL=1